MREGGLAECAACVVGGVSGVEPLNVVGLCTAFMVYYKERYLGVTV